MEMAYLLQPIKPMDCCKVIKSILEPAATFLGSVAETEIQGIADSRNKGKNCLGFFSHNNFDEIESNLQSCFLITDKAPPASLQTGNTFCIVDDPRSIFISLLEQLITAPGIKPQTSIMILPAGTSRSAKISSQAIIEDGVAIGENVQIGAGCIIKSGTEIGPNTIIRENTVIGSIGITVYKNQKGQLQKFPHVCGVKIGANTEIGANCVIPRGILTSTIIGDNVVIGSLCNIGHGCNVGNSVWISAGGLIGGHTLIGDNVSIGLGVSIRDNLVIENNTSIGMGSVVVKKVRANTSVFGNPAQKMTALKTAPNR
jgi:UDP-3-O-[3-hydroxymyristoyl] glucosamine N-acyltransferase